MNKIKNKINYKNIFVLMLFLISSLYLLAGSVSATSYTESYDFTKWGSTFTNAIMSAVFPGLIMNSSGLYVAGLVFISVFLLLYGVFTGVPFVQKDKKIHLGFGLIFSLLAIRGLSSAGIINNLVNLSTFAIYIMLLIFFGVVALGTKIGRHFHRKALGHMTAAKMEGKYQMAMLKSKSKSDDAIAISIGKAETKLNHFDERAKELNIHIGDLMLDTSKDHSEKISHLNIEKQESEFAVKKLKAYIDAMNQKKENKEVEGVTTQV